MYMYLLTRRGEEGREQKRKAKGREREGGRRGEGGRGKKGGSKGEKGAGIVLFSCLPTVQFLKVQKWS